MINTVKKSTLYLSQIAVSGLLMLALMSVISQYLAPEELGKFVLVQIYAGVAVGIANFGMLLSYERNFFMYEISVSQSSKLIYSAISFVSFNLIVLLILVFLFKSEISSLLFSDSSSSDLIFIIALSSTFLSLSQYFLTYLKNTGSAVSYVTNLILNSIIYVILALVLMVQFELGVMSLAYASMATNVVLFFILLFSLKSILPLGFDKEMLKGMLKISLPLTPRVFFGFLNTQVDKILLGLIGSSALVGVYHIGQVFAATIFQFMTGLDRVFQPELYRKLFAEKHIKSSSEINDYILPFFYLSVFFALLVALFSREFIFLFFSSQYQGSASIIAILSIYYASLFFGKITGNQLIYAKKTYITTLLTFLGIALNLTLNIPFIMTWGITGAALATTFCGIIITLISFSFAQKYTKITWKWKSIFVIYSLFLIGIALDLFVYHIAKYVYTAVTLKILVVIIYIFCGYRLKIISNHKLRMLIEKMLLKKSKS